MTCKHLVQLGVGVFFCRHPKVHTPDNLVTPEFHCEHCRFANLDCDPCRDLPADPPSLIQKAINFGTALARFVASGMRRRTDAEVLAIQEICRACEWWREGICTHKKCGCRTTRKAPWATERCPVGKW